MLTKLVIILINTAIDIQKGDFKNICCEYFFYAYQSLHLKNKVEILF